MKKYILLALTVLASFSCDEQFEELNKDPMVAFSATPNAVLPFVFTDYAARKMSELGLALAAVYHHVGAIFNSPAGGTVGSFTTGNLWAVWYTNLLGNLKLLERDAASTGAASNNIQAVSKIMQAHLFFELTCIYGSIPFQQALNETEYPTPEFDNQRTVMYGVVAMLDEAMTLIDNMPGSGNYNFETGDLLLQGDITRWKRFANSLKIRTLMYIRNVPSEKDKANQLLIEAFGNDVIASPVFFKMLGASGSEHGLFHVLKAYFGSSDNEVQKYFGPSPTMRNILVNNNDPRVGLWLVDLGGTGEYPVASYGNIPDDDETIYSNKLIRATLPEIYMLPGEIIFYRAELLLDGVAIPGSGGSTAQEAFETAVRSELEYWGGGIDSYEGTPLSRDAIDTYINGLGTVTFTKIYEQLWIESIFRPIAAWNTVRRTKVPPLAPPGSATITTILKRFPYPPLERGTNPNIPKESLENDTPMWFEG